MSPTALVLFVPLAILCNTVVPVPFDPVLIAFASRQSPAAAAVLAIVGSACAGIAAALDLTLFRNLRRRASGRWVRFLPLWSGGGTYVLTFLFALLPLPFSIVRMAMFRNPPRMIPYQLSVALGRLPRYLATIYLWRMIPWTAGGQFIFCTLVLLIVAFHWIWKLKFSRERLDIELDGKLEDRNCE